MLCEPVFVCSLGMPVAAHTSVNLVCRLPAWKAGSNHDEWT